MHVVSPLHSWLPAFNTALIVISGLFLLLGYFFIKQGRELAHKRCMLTATTFAALFLVVYVLRLLLIGSKGFGGQGAAYMIYLGILVPHVIAATAVAPLALTAIALALRDRRTSHRRVARITFPIWLFAASSGWVIFLMLYVIEWGP